MKIGEIWGWHILVFLFAVTLLAVPISELAINQYQWGHEEKELVRRGLPFIICTILILAIRPLRRWARTELARPIPRDRRTEVIVVVLGKAILYGAAAGGALALFYWMRGNGIPPSEAMAGHKPSEASIVAATSGLGIARQLLFYSLAGPILEELVVRGLLYRAWERRWGWFPAMIMSSICFALYHKVFVAAFMSSLVFTCVLRRTGTLWAPIAVHGLFNLSLWYPLMGQFAFTGIPGDPDSLAAWTPHLLSLLVVAIAIPVYVFMARNAYPIEGPDHALPK